MSLAPQLPCTSRLSVLRKPFFGLTALVLGVSFLLSATQVWAAGKTEKTAEKKGEEETIPPPEDIDLTTDDGLAMKATYFPGTKSEESIPVILLHGLKGSRKDFTQEQGLAAFLQEKLGCAVIVPDLRGHGDSTKIKISSKRTEDLKGKKLLPTQISAMVTEDLRAVKDFLWKKNNEKALNIDKLVVVGVDMGAALALSYAAYDAYGYEQRQAKYGPLKLGRFVKGVVLISPVTSIPGLKPTTLQVMKMPEVCRDLPVMIVVGNKSKDRFAEAERLCVIFMKSRPPAKDDRPQSITVYFYKKIETSLQGSELLAEPSLNVPEKIAKFLTNRLLTNEDAKDYAWKERKLPHE